MRSPATEKSLQQLPQLTSVHDGLRETLGVLAKRAIAAAPRRTLSRRDALLALGGGALAASPLAALAQSASCTLIPIETAGPYPGDGTNGPNALTQSGIVRANIKSSFGAAGTATAAGTALDVTLQLVNTNASCASLAGYAVYLWHCDANGGYSLYSSGVTTQNYLRGVQVSDASGLVTFNSIFPGCYDGRWPHIHFEVFSSLGSAIIGTNSLRTSQLALPEAQSRLVYAQTALYPSSLTNLGRVTLASDNVFSTDQAVSQLATTTGSVAAGFAASLKVGIAGPTGSSTITPTVAVTDMWWNAAESGWGLSAIQHSSNKVFVVIYSYAADGRPLWFVMPDSTWTSGTSFNGTLYQTSGPVFTSNPFDPTRVTATAVGTFTMTTNAAATSASISYTVNGTSVNKTVTRQSF
jgi:protocatechuate 3,4-dioxygenase beta subunit